MLTVLAGCGDDPELRPQSLPPRAAATIPAYDVDAEIAVGAAALSLVPADATAITVTDFDQVRATLGVPHLTSDDPMSDRRDFWERARRESVLLAEGMLLDDGSELMLDHGFTQDDVDWEAHFTTPAGKGWILGFRADLDMGAVQAAVDAGVAGLAGGVVDTAQHLVSLGAVSSSDTDVDTWGTIEGIADLTHDAPAESTYYRAGCVPLSTALGPDAHIEDQEAVVSAHDPTDLDPLSAVAMSFNDGLATARLGPERPDLFDRAELATDFPTVGHLGFEDAFVDGVVDPSTGRIGYSVVEPGAAARATLTDLLPFAVCNEVKPMGL
ncbi:MAG: LigA [Nocardioides sp.]|jgi:hypothetical protein|nr:LigA [Nocardioides sp.]